MNLDMLFGFVVFFILGFTGVSNPNRKFCVIYGWIFEQIDLGASALNRVKLLSCIELVASLIFLLLSIIIS